MANPSPLETERRLKSRRQGLVIIVIVLLSTLSGVLAATNRIAAHDGRAVDLVRVGAFVVLSLALLVFVLTGGRWAIGNPAMNDELVRMNRARALRTGYIILILAIVGTYVAMLFTALDFTAVLPALVMIGVATPALSFALLERRGES